MELSKSDHLPERAGIIQLSFRKNSDTQRLPVRQERSIVLPDDDDLWYTGLRGGEQFLVFLEKTGPHGEVWYGGTEEQIVPFLVQIFHEPLRVFTENGETAFMESFKPPLVQMLERHFQVSAQRYGFVFAVPLPFSREELPRLFGMYAILQTMLAKSAIGGGLREHSFTEIRDKPILETKHVLTGYATTEIRAASYVSKSTFEYVPHLLAEGILQAPEYPPFRMDGLHLLMRARYVMNRRQHRIR